MIFTNLKIIMYNIYESLKIPKNKNIQYGGLDKPSWSESLSAFYIVFLGLTIKSSYYKLLFILNGLSSSFAHSPMISKNIELQKQMNSLDSITIWYPLMAKTILDKLALSEADRIKYLILILFLNFYNNKIGLFIYQKLAILSILLVVKQSYHKLDKEMLLWILSSIVLKVYEKRVILKVGKEKIRIHTLWHIFGTQMFKKLIEL